MKYRYLLPVLALVLTAWTPSPPAGVTMLMSRPYQLTATCTGGDEVFSWSVGGNAGAGGNSAAPTLGPVTSQYPNGSPPASGNAGSSFIWPWQATDVSIRAVEITEFPPAAGYDTSPIDGVSAAPGGVDYIPAYSFLMVGSNAEGDVMMYLDAKHIHAYREFPAGTAYEFPGWNNMSNQTYIDLHGSCTPGMTANVGVTFYYTSP